MHWEILLENIARDVRLAIRSLRRDRRSSLLAMAALALGIGATTVIFSLVYGVLLNPFPYKDSDRLVTFAIENLTNQGASTGRNWFSWQEFLTFHEENHIFEDLVAYHAGLAQHGRSRWRRSSFDIPRPTSPPAPLIFMACPRSSDGRSHPRMEGQKPRRYS